MLPDRVWNPGPLTYESGALPTALHSPATNEKQWVPGLLYVSLIYIGMQVLHDGLGFHSKQNKF